MNHEINVKVLNKRQFTNNSETASIENSKILINNNTSLGSHNCPCLSIVEIFTEEQIH